MATKNLNLGIVPVSRGEFNSTTIYYKDNIVQYKRGSYQVVSESPIIGVPPTNDKNIVNPGWTLFAGTLDAQDVVNQVKDQETKSIQAVADREAEILAKSDAAEVSFNNTGTSFSGTNVQNALKETDNKLSELESEVIYDVTANNDGTTFSSLSALLSSENLSTLIPTSVRHGGMSIRFVQSSDNKYVQYRLMKNTWSTDFIDWQGDNFVTLVQYAFDSNKFIDDIENGIDIKSMSIGHFNVNGILIEGSSFVYQKIEIDHTKAYKINISESLDTYLISSFVMFDDNNNVIYANGHPYAIDLTIMFPEGIKYFGISSRYPYMVSLSVGDLVLKRTLITTDNLMDEVVTQSKIANDAVTTNKILNKSVHPEKCNFFSSKNNIYDCNNIEIKHGYYLYTDNVLYKNETYFVSQFILIESETEYLIMSFPPQSHTNLCRFICYYDENQNFISAYEILTSEWIFTTPQNAKYLRFTGYESDYRYYVVSTDTNINSFIPYKLLIDEEYLPVKSQILPDIIVARKNYILNGVQNSIYFKSIMNFYNPNLYAIDRYSGQWIFKERCMRTDGTDTDMSIKLVDIIDLKILKRVNTITCKGLPDTNDGLKFVNVIGDSFTYNGKWFDKINDLCPNLSFVGMRKSYNTNASLRAEGRGGWTLHSYATLDVNAEEGMYYVGFSPFLHPSGYIYYGVTGFWADIVNNNIGSHTYEMNGFDDFISMFGTDGKKLNPSINDMMYDTTQNSYIYYNGSSWATYSGTPTFEFNYSKYITAWNITSPDFVLIMLGVNDFFGNYTTERGTQFVSEMQALITSIQAYATSANKTIIIGICTNNTISSLPSSNYGTNNVLNSRYLFNGRKKVISTFDNDTYEAQNVFVIDTAATFDADYGFNVTYDKPFSYYEGDEKEMYDNNGVHPSNAGYSQLGTCAAGFIQYMRGL